MSQGDKHSYITSALEKRVIENRLRSLKTVQTSDKSIIKVDGKEYINFSGNDYLGLSKHPDLISKSHSFTEQYGSGSTASRLISGTLSIHTQLEDKLAKFFGYEACLLFNSGFQANTGILSAIADRHSLIIGDKKIHNSLIQGAKLSGAEFKRYSHNDLEHLEDLLKKAQKQDYNRVWVVTETVFSMDGDISAIKKISGLCSKYSAHLYSDDAHAIGILGEKGRGLNPGVSGVDISIGTFGKAFGAFGAFVGCSREMKEYLINYCPAVIYTTSLPPSVIGSIDAALDLIPAMDSERQHVQDHSRALKKAMTDLGYSTSDSNSQIVPIVIGKEDETLELSAFLADHGIYAIAIRPPTVAKGASRIRITLTASHSDEQVQQLINAFKEWKNR